MSSFENEPLKIFEPLRGAHVAGWFQDYVAGKRRVRPIPDAAQCEGIAVKVNGCRRSLQGVMMPAPLNDQFDEVVKRAMALQKRLHKLVNAWTEITKNGHILDLEAKRRFESDVEMLSAVTTFLAEFRPRRPGVDGVFGELFEVVAAALHQVGWSKVSPASEGPGLTILTKCLEQIYGRRFKVATIARRMREQQQTSGH